MEGYGFTDVVGEKDGLLHIIEAKNGRNPRLTDFQKKAFPKIKYGAKIEFFGPKANQFKLPKSQLSNYTFEIRRYQQYIYPR